MKTFFKIIVSICGIILPYSSFSKGEPLKDTSRLKTTIKSITISKEHLYKIVDSLLDLSNINDLQIETINYYYSLLQENHSNYAMVHLGDKPATSFYDDFDESTVFQITPEEELPENQLLVIKNDSLGNYMAPRLGLVTSNFGWRSGRMHKGIDINLNKGDVIIAAFDGMVRFAQSKGGFGNVVIVRHYNGLETVYAHLSKIKVKTGQILKAGDILGLGGSTGRSSGPHLHFEVRFKGHAINPASIISFSENQLHNDSIIIKKSKYGICAFPSNATLHTIERGDSWFDIAKRYGLSLKDLCSLNGTEKRYYLKIGEKLRVN